MPTQPALLPLTMLAMRDSSATVMAGPRRALTAQAVLPKHLMIGQPGITPQQPPAAQSPLRLSAIKCTQASVCMTRIATWWTPPSMLRLPGYRHTATLLLPSRTAGITPRITLSIHMRMIVMPTLAIATWLPTAARGRSIWITLPILPDHMTARTNMPSVPGTSVTATVRCARLTRMHRKTVLTTLKFTPRQHIGMRSRTPIKA